MAEEEVRFYLEPAPGEPKKWVVKYLDGLQREPSWEEIVLWVSVKAVSARAQELEAALRAAQQSVDADVAENEKSIELLDVHQRVEELLVKLAASDHRGEGSGLAARLEAWIPSCGAEVPIQMEDLLREAASKLRSSPPEKRGGEAEWNLIESATAVATAGWGDRENRKTLGQDAARLRSELQAARERSDTDG